MRSVHPLRPKAGGPSQRRDEGEGGLEATVVDPALWRSAKGVGGGGAGCARYTPFDPTREDLPRGGTKGKGVGGDSARSAFTP